MHQERPEASGNRVPTGLRSEERATREGGASRAPGGEGDNTAPGGERESRANTTPLALRRGGRQIRANGAVTGRARGPGRPL